MNLDLDNAGGSGSSDSRTYYTDPRLPGVRISQRVVLTAKQISKTKPHDSFSNAVDLGVKMEIENDPFDWYPEVTSFGNFRRDPHTGAVTGLGGAFKPMATINRLGTRDPGQNLTPEFEMQREWIERAVGREILVVEYVAKLSEPNDKGRQYPRYYTWDMIERVGRDPIGDEKGIDPATDTFETAAKRLITEFQQAYNEGYVKNYRPAVLDQLGAGGDGASREPALQAGPTQTASPFASQPANDGYDFTPDDDLPF